ncbi:hypothetical protein [Nocardia sp. NPDC019395]|uniref:hypothetical protein n=1 Tax=Nocardia sp. NPDC019395 TaxID=3154686 RepID=UPI0033DF0BB3
MGIGDWIGDHWDDAVVGVASAAGFALLGPAGAALAGGVTGGLTALAQGEDPLEAAAFGAAGGVLGGALGVVGKGGWAAFGKSAIEGAKGLKNGGVRGAYTGVRSLLGDSNKRMIYAMASSGSMAFPSATDSMLREPWYQWRGYPEVPLMDISAEELSDIPDGMPPVRMPDPEQLPYGLEFGPAMQQNYRTLPRSYLAIRKNFGEKPSKTTLPKELEVADISGEESSGIPNYIEWVGAMREQYKELRALSGAVSKAAVERTEELCECGRKDVDASIEALTTFAEAHPRHLERISSNIDDYEKKLTQYGGSPIFLVDRKQVGAGLNEDAYAMVLIGAASTSLQGILAGYNAEFEALADKTDDQKPDEKHGSGSKGDDEKKSTDEEKTGAGADGDTDTTDPSYKPNGQDTDTEAAGAPEVNSEVPAPDPLDLSGESDPVSDSDQAADSAGTSDIEAADIGQTEPGTSASEAVPGVAQTASVASPAASGVGGGGLESMMLPQLIQAMMAAGRNGAPGETDGEKQTKGVPQNRGPAAAPGSHSAPAQTPAANAQAQAQAAGQAPPAKSVSAPPNAGPPPGGPAPDSAGNIVYTFPDGQTQEVSRVAAQVLDAAFGNAAGTDARAAYRGTPAEWSDTRHIGDRKSPGQAMTGDVGVWDGRTAVLVKFDEPESPPAIIADGVLHPIAELDDMRDAEGEFGAFVGIFRPPGIEKAEPGQGPGPSGQPADDAALGATVPA